MTCARAVVRHSRRMCGHVRACAAAVKRANEETGRKCIYAPCINAPAHLVVQRAKFAKAAGAGAVLMIPGITGLDRIRNIKVGPDTRKAAEHYYIQNQNLKLDIEIIIKTFIFY